MIIVKANKVSKMKKKYQTNIKVNITVYFVFLSSAHDRSNVVSPVILEMRSSLPALNEGEEILARWSDEGWYYSGKINFTYYT